VALVQRPLSESDLDQMWEIELEAFNVDPAHRESWRRWECAAGPERFEGIFLDGRLIAAAGVLGLGQWFGERSVPMGGVRAVVVRSEHRGRGHATRAVRACLAAMRARGEVVSALYPAVVRPYRRLGWGIAGTLVFRTVPTRALAAVPASTVPVRRATASDRDVIRACYERVARDTNGFVDRSSGRWDWMFWRIADDYVFVAGEDGYVVYRHLDKPPAGPEGFRILVLELVATTADAYRALWGLLAAASSVVPAITYRSGPTDLLSSLLDGLEIAVARERQWMLRLVDAPAAIAARGWTQDRRVAVPLDIVDDDCPWNAGRHVLVVEDGHGQLEPGGSGAVRLGIGAFSSLYSGFATTPLLARTGLLEGGTAIERAALDRVFAGPTPWMLDEF